MGIETLRERDRLQECDYTLLPEDIHALTLNAGTETCVRMCFAHLTTVFKEAPLDQPLLILSDITESGVPPLAPLWRYSRSLLQQFPQRPMACDAIIHRQDGRLFPAFVVVVRQLAQLFGARVAFYRESERGKAIEWLLSQRKRLKP